MVHWANASLPPQTDLDRFSRFGGLTVASNAQTDHATPFVAVGCIGAMHATRPNNVDLADTSAVTVAGTSTEMYRGKVTRNAARAEYMHDGANSVLVRVLDGMLVVQDARLLVISGHIARIAVRRRMLAFVCRPHTRDCFASYFQLLQSFAN